MSIYKKFMLMVLALMGMILLMTGVTYVKEKAALSTSIEQNGMTILDQSLKTMTNAMQSMAGIIENTGLAVQQGWDSKNFGEKEALESFMKASLKLNKAYGFESIFFGYEASGLFADGTGWQAPPDFDPRKRGWYKKALAANGKVIFSEPYVNASLGKIIFSVCIPVWDENRKLLGVLGSDVDMDGLNSLVSSLKIQGAGEAVLLSPAGTIAAGPRKEDIMKVNMTTDQNVLPDLRSVAKAMISGKSGHTVVQKDEGKYLSFYGTTPSGFSLGIFYPLSAVTQSVRTLTDTLLLVAVIALIFILLLTYLLYRSINRPLGHVSALAKEISQGNLTASPVSIGYTARDSLGAMLKALSEMIESLRDIVTDFLRRSDQINESSAELLALGKESNNNADNVLKAMLDITTFGRIAGKNAAGFVAQK